MSGKIDRTALNEAARDAVAQVMTVPLMILGWGVFIALLVASLD